MTRRLTFGRRMTAGFAVILALTVVVDVIAVIALNRVVAGKDHVINVNSRLLLDAETLRAAIGEKSAAARGYLLTGDSKYLDEMATARGAFKSALDAANHGISSTEERRLTQAIAQDETAHQQAIDSVVTLRKSGAPLPAVGHAFADQVDPKRTALVASITSFVKREDQLLAKGQHDADNTASNAITLIVVMAAVAAAIAAAFAFLLNRALRRQIGTAVGEVKSSSAELEATANQQATGAKEQATAMSEITTTISELLATSRQIAESAQRVAQVAEQTAGAGRSGEDTIRKAQESITDIRRQVDVIVDHMLELGEKSQQIGAVLDIVTELAEQTNILAINSTIEAAGAGEAGKRFAVVADEIRKLADRVADSTKEIRGLIDVVRAAVNTTVMATEIGSKAVDAGSEQFGDVTNAFGEIAGLVATTTDAAREIELSTKQQTTAVEQVNIAISNVAQSTREAEASSSQTYQTASQLSSLSLDLARLVEAQAAQ